MFFIGIILAFGVILLNIVTVGSFGLFVSPGSFIITFGIPLFLILATNSGKGLKLMFQLFVSDDFPEEDLKTGLNIYKDAKLYLIVAGWIGFIVGAIFILALPEIEEPKAYTHGTAVALITVFYGYTAAYCLCHPVIRKIQNKISAIAE